MPAQQTPVRYIGVAKLPRIVTGPVSKKHYLVNPNKLDIQVDDPDVVHFLQLTGEVRFERLDNGLRFAANN